ncbi:MAG: hypothetical protein JWM33_4032 [Caulobacteraceae bacterium]|nr:hypothetical protein [Caulobacteraceae bacterium]
MRSFLIAFVSLGAILAIAVSMRPSPAQTAISVGPALAVPASAFLAVARTDVASSGMVQVNATGRSREATVLRVLRNNRIVLERSLPQGDAGGPVDMGAFMVSKGDALTLQSSASGDVGAAGVTARVMAGDELKRESAASLRANRMLAFRDDFNGDAWDPQSSVWATLNKQGGRIHPTSPDSVYSDRGFSAQVGAGAAMDPFSLHDGVLTIRAGKIPTGNLGPVRAALGDKAPANLTGPDSLRYFSGDLETNATWSQTYGYFEMRAKLPRGEGFWPAFWLTSTRGWPPEIDMLEAVYHADTKAGVNQIHSALHYKRVLSGDQATGPELTAAVDTPVAPLGADLYNEFHLYAAGWTPQWISIYFDEQLIYRVATPPQLNGPMQLMANLQIGKLSSNGGTWAADFTDDGNLGNALQIDYIAAYLDGQAYPTVQTASPGGPVNAPGELAPGLAGSTLVGDAGANTITTGPGTDIVRTGGGGDTIIINAGKDAHKIIEGFDPAAGAKLDLEGFALRTPADVLARARQIGPDVWILLGRLPQPPQSVILRNLSLRQLTPAAIRIGAGPQRPDRPNQPAGANRANPGQVLKPQLSPPAKLLKPIKPPKPLKPVKGF